RFQPELVRCCRVAVWRGETGAELRRFGNWPPVLRNSNPTMSNKEEKPEESQSNWKDFIYNPRSGEFIGRTASSWALIFLFYLVFYGFLAGMFSLTMWVMLQTLDDYTPKYRDRVSNPGLVIRPKSMDIMFNRTDPAKYREYVKHLDSFLQLKKVCPFKRSLLRQCSGLSDETFGYSEGRPCILVKMNRIIGLKPRGEPYINCTAKPNYVQPLVAVKLLLTKEDYNQEIAVECKVEGSDLRNNDERDKFLGRVNFRVKVME
ncbi:hypothetical protein JZ751_001942, partial [Albula glossodonta]